MAKAPVVLMILDGFGLREERAHNAVALAQTPVLDRLFARHPWTAVRTNGRHVGLQGDTMGNSEVGHMNLGAGRVVWQDSSRLSNAVADGSFFESPALVGAFAHARALSTRVHLWGLCSDGIVHTAEEHYLALLELARRQDCRGDRLCVHAFLDGRDTPPQSAGPYLTRLQARMDETGCGVIGSIQGRFFAMDRDQRWERVSRAYRLLTEGEGRRAPDAAAALAAAYARGETDEFVPPTAVVDAAGRPRGLIGEGDAVIFFNFRADRARELSHAFLDDEWPHFPRPVRPRLHHVSMTHYDDTLDGRTHVAFAPHRLTGLFGELLAAAGRRQLRIAETEKYAHVTFFFNGGQERTFDGEERVLIPSPKVETYDLQPEMSAHLVTERLGEELARDRYDAVILNFANGDMVGHTGALAAAIKAVETLDVCIGRVVEAVLARGGQILLTADHGNCEEMWDAEANAPHTQHTKHPCPALLISPWPERYRLRGGGKLADLAPTLCDLLDLEPSPEMTGRSLLAPAPVAAGPG